MALKSYLAMASILSGAQGSAAWSGGEGSLPCWSDPALWAQPRLSSGTGSRTPGHTMPPWIRTVQNERSGPIEGSPALPVGLPSQPPRPLAQPSALPSRQEPRAPSSSSQPQPPGDWQACRPMAAAARALPDHTSSFLPLGVQEPAGVPVVSAFSPSTLTLLSAHEMQSTERKACPRGWPPTLLTDTGPFPPFSYQPIWLFEKAGSPSPQSKGSSVGLVPGCFNCSLKLNLRLP